MAELSLVQLSPDVFDHWDSFSNQFQEDRDAFWDSLHPNDNPVLDIEFTGNGLYLFLAGESDFAGAWFENARSHHQAIALPHTSAIQLVEPFTGGKWCEQYQSHVLDAEQVKTITTHLQQILSEDFEYRWATVSAIRKHGMRRVMGDLVNLLMPEPLRSLEQNLGSIAEFSDFFEHRLVAFYQQAVEEGKAIAVIDCT